MLFLYSLHVEKEGSNETCGYDSKETPWGCTHTGDAYIYKLNETKYYSHISSEEVSISQAQGGSYDFHLEHHFNSTLEKDYYNDHQMRGTLRIKATGNKKKNFSHPKNKNTDTQNFDGTANENYKGGILVKVNCDENCLCSMHKTIV